MKILTISAILVTLDFTGVETFARLKIDDEAQTASESSDETVSPKEKSPKQLNKTKTQAKGELSELTNATDQSDTRLSIPDKPEPQKVAWDRKREKERSETIQTDAFQGTSGTPFFKEVPLRISPTTIGSYMIYKSLEDIQGGPKDSSMLRSSEIKKDMFYRDRSDFGAPSHTYGEDDIGIPTTYEAHTENRVLRKSKLFSSSLAKNMDSVVNRKKEEDKVSGDNLAMLEESDEGDGISDLSLAARITKSSGDGMKHLEKHSDQIIGHTSGDNMVSSTDKGPGRTFSADARQSVQHPGELGMESGQVREELEDVDVIYSDWPPYFG